eukprot:snap_masked-scaffold_2-processed-gene-9.40-mRNA-1 protein AED:1.00 eAED:1.00 QI:0/-1/0/0/-1/1/1/0/65
MSTLKSELVSAVYNWLLKLKRSSSIPESMSHLTGKCKHLKELQNPDTFAKNFCLTPFKNKIKSSM